MENYTIGLRPPGPGLLQAQSFKSMNAPHWTFHCYPYEKPGFPMNQKARRKKTAGLESFFLKLTKHFVDLRHEHTTPKFFSKLNNGENNSQQLIMMNNPIHFPPYCPPV